MVGDWIVPDWPVPARVKALVTTRLGGVSQGCYASLNLGSHVGDDPCMVAENRARLRARLPAEPTWLEQVHGVGVVELAPSAVDAGREPLRADAAFTRGPGAICAVLTADCLPVLLCDREATVVAAVHAGWRGLAAGVLEATIARLGRPPGVLMAWLGPAIGPDAFEVGADVHDVFVADDPRSEGAFRPKVGSAKWVADLCFLARLRLSRAGVEAVYGGQWCTYGDPARFYSYRRDGVTGRFASLIWLDA